jgi:hypothetical protein
MCVLLAVILPPEESYTYFGASSLHFFYAAHPMPELPQSINMMNRKEPTPSATMYICLGKPVPVVFK